MPVRIIYKSKGSDLKLHKNHKYAENNLRKYSRSNQINPNCPYKESLILSLTTTSNILQKTTSATYHKKLNC